MANDNERRNLTMADPETMSGEERESRTSRAGQTKESPEFPLLAHVTDFRLTTEALSPFSS
jgi:hypothetical protein